MTHRIRLDFIERTPAETAERASAFRALMARRRTVRDFSDRAVPKEVIADCVMTGASAPSGANQQPWTFVCISDPETTRNIREAAEEEAAVETIDDVDDVEIEDDDTDDTFLEEEEGEDDDVAGLIDGDIETDEEG